MEKEAAKKAAKEVAEEVNWTDYFASIVSVCPWSKAYWAKQKIDVVRWEGVPYPLDGYVARMYIAYDKTPTQLKNIMKRHNDYFDDEEWLYSHPKFGGHSTPVPVLIQQDYDVLAKARSHHKYTKQS